MAKGKISLKCEPRFNVFIMYVMIKLNLPFKWYMKTKVVAE